MYNKIKLLVFLFCLSSGSILAQNIQVLMSPKPSPYISDWQQQTETVKLVISNSSSKEIEVKIKTELYDGKGALIASTEASKMPVLTISPNSTTTYDPEDIFPSRAINYYGSLEKTAITTGRIPDDNYRICVTLTDPQSGKSVGTSGTVCKVFTIVAYQAPTLINPTNKEIIKGAAIKGIVFRWSPVIPSPKAIVTYRLQVWEVLEGQNSMTALRSNQPIVEKDLKGMLQTQWPIDFSLPDTGKTYVWTITPLDDEGRKLVDGLGFSEPFEFRACCWPPPIQAPTEWPSVMLISPGNGEEVSGNITFSWTNKDVTPKEGYTLRIVELKGDQSPDEAIANNSAVFEQKGIKSKSFKLGDSVGKLKEGKKYAWAVKRNNGFSEPFTFTITTNKTISFPTVTAKVDCYKILSGVQSYAVHPVIINGSFTVSSWTVTSSNSTLLPNPTQGTPASILPMATNVANNIYFTNPTSNPVSLTFTFSYTNNTQYSATIQINYSNCNTCCGNNAFTAIKLGTTVYDCGSTVPGSLPAGSIHAVTFIGACNSGCPTMVKYAVVNSSNVLVTPIYTTTVNTPINVSIPNLNGNYCLKARIFCEGQLCDSCSLCFRVDSMNIDCCKAGQWLQKKIGNQNIISCPSELGNPIPCSSIKPFTFQYACNPEGNCSGTIEYVVRKTSNNAFVMSISTPNDGLPHNVSMPTIDGNYYVTAFAKCGNKICDSCRIYFKVICVDCCKGGKWGSSNFFANEKANCNTVLKGVLHPGSVQTANFTYYCNPGYPQQCIAKLRYRIQTPAGQNVGSIITGNSGQTVNINIPTTPGKYCLKVFAYCSDTTKPCDSCRICFIVSCVDCNNVKQKDLSSSLFPFDVKGNFTVVGSPIKYVTAQLINIYANNSLGSTLKPIPNFEFTSISPFTLSTISPSGPSVPVLMPFSLTGQRSNIVVSTFPLPSTTVNYNLRIRPNTNFNIKYYRIKFTLFFANGTYCEKTITKTF